MDSISSATSHPGTTSSVDSAFKTVVSSAAHSLPPISTCLKDNAALLPGVLPPHHLPPQYPHPHQPHPETGFHHPRDHYALHQHIQQQQQQQHPAFPVSPWIQQTQAYNLAQLQHLLAGESKALAGPLLPDSVTKATLLDLGRLHAHYPLNKKLFGCPQCRYITDRKNNLKRHVATMHQDCDKALECCGITFKNKASLRDHVLIFHSNGYMCRFCGRNFCRKALLKRHLTVHSGQKDYICAHCDYATSHKSNLERHKKVHEKQSTDEEDTISTEKPSSESNTALGSPYSHQRLFGRATEVTQSLREVTRSTIDVTGAASLSSFRASSTTTMIHSPSSSSSSSSSSTRADLVNNHLSAAGQVKAIGGEQTLDNDLDADLSLSNIDVVGVDIADQAAALIDVVRMHE